MSRLVDGVRLTTRGTLTVVVFITATFPHCSNEILRRNMLKCLNAEEYDDSMSQYCSIENDEPRAAKVAQ